MIWLYLATTVFGCYLFCRFVDFSVKDEVFNRKTFWHTIDMYSSVVFFTLVVASISISNIQKLTALSNPSDYSHLRDNVIYKSLDDFKYGDDNCKVLESQFGVKLILKIEQKDLPQSNYYRAIKSGDSFKLEPFSTENETPFLEKIEPAVEGVGRPK